MFLGYNTNGFAHHDLLEAAGLLHRIGYRGLAITIDHRHLSWMDERTKSQRQALQHFLAETGMKTVIETGARYLLDPENKHEPTLLSGNWERRRDFYRWALCCAADLGSRCVSIWSGVIPEGVSRTEAWDRLTARLPKVFEMAEEFQVPVAFEPEPGMFIDALAAFEKLLKRFDHPLLGLTLDVGHLQCNGETPIPEFIRRGAPRLINVHLEDMRRGEHVHRMFGEGEIDFPPVLKALGECGYTGCVYVELSRHSHAAPQAARKAFEFLQYAAAKAGVVFENP
ncbi:MAG: sugar phosphate isomerase/epimerase [Pirellulales bacterium]|nr:sugar phosphate isomerase/epimerase [Pirellulales bacterium]